MCRLARRRGSRSAFTLIELLVVIAIIGVLIALLLPAVQAAREAARRSQCINNLKQLGLGMANYVDQQGSYPMNGYWRYCGYGYLSNSFGFFVPILPFIEQKQMFDATNVSLCALAPDNWTMYGLGISTLWCPSDGSASRAITKPISAQVVSAPSGNVNVLWSSYAGSVGTWMLSPSPPDLPDYGYSNPNFQSDVDSMTGLIYISSSNKIADIRDGTSNTILMGERSLTILSQTDRPNWGYWFTGLRTQFTTMFPLNPQKKVPDIATANLGNVFGGAATVYKFAASSNHPGGANFVFCDGSVHFIKETINSWQMDQVSGDPIGVTFNSSTGLMNMAPGTRPGVYQALSTRAGSETISADSY
jgi:prepilin-type N-terminal cleavage/methylation domain-containing protein/prepilin-type processing-associated H-X9-DG protein